MGLLASVGNFVRRFLGSEGRPAGENGGGPPVYPGDFPDPFVLRAGDAYFAYGTQTGSTNVQVMTSPDLVRWEHLGDALPRLASWAGGGRTWAPVVLQRRDAYVLYYTVRDPGSDRQAISVAVGSRPRGPFTDDSAGPLVFQPDRGGSIDPSPFVDADGTAYLLWKSDDNALQRPSSLWGQPLSEDGLAVVGAPTELLRHDRGWERPLVEAPAMVTVDGTYYLFYSANWWESGDYAVGYATAAAPMGPFRKVTTAGPWMASGGEAAGPGGQELFTDSGGGLRMAYHAWTPGRVSYGIGGARTLRIARIEFERGVPVARP